jgi:hypothetical protein
LFGDIFGVVFLDAELDALIARLEQLLESL